MNVLQIPARTSSARGTTPQTPAQIMHKADRKYEIGEVTDEEQAKQRQLKGILNKLTPQNFEKLFQQVKDVNIDNAITLNGVISQIFDKALMEPTFCEMYANFCSHLATELPDLSIDNEKITFKRLLLNKCQEEFERGEREEQEANVTNEEGEVTMSAEETEEKRVKARRRWLGNIRLIGELYKKRILAERIIHECIKKLLGEYQNPDEENVEALCILMSTIGEMIDRAKVKVYMDAYFDMMENMSNNMKLSSRVRFMLRYSIDMRKNKWQQKRKVEGPKKTEDCSRSSKRKCFCGEYALHLTAWTRANAGRRFYKCCKPDKISCGYWEWDDKPLPDRAMIVIKSLKTSLDEARLEKSEFNEKMEEMKAFNLSQLMKNGKLEERVLKMKIIIMVSWAFFIGFAFASIVGR